MAACLLLTAQVLGAPAGGADGSPGTGLPLARHPRRGQLLLRLSPCPAPSTQRPAHGPETCTQTHTPELTTSGAPGASHPNHTAAPAGEAQPREGSGGGRQVGALCYPGFGERAAHKAPFSSPAALPRGRESHSHIFQEGFRPPAAPPAKPLCPPSCLACASINTPRPGLRGGALGPPLPACRPPSHSRCHAGCPGKQKETRPGWPGGVEGAAGQGHWPSLAARCPRQETRPLICAPSAARGRHAGWTRSPRNTWAGSHGSGSEAA